MRLAFRTKREALQHMAQQGWTATTDNHWMRDKNEMARVYQCPVTTKWRIHEWRN